MSHFINTTIKPQVSVQPRLHDTSGLTTALTTGCILLTGLWRWRTECRWWAWLAGRWYWRAGRLSGWPINQSLVY